MVPSVTSVCNQRANTLTLSTYSPSKPPRRTLPSTSKPRITIGSMDHYSQSLFEEGISEGLQSLSFEKKWYYLKLLFVME